MDLGHCTSLIDCFGAGAKTAQRRSRQSMASSYTTQISLKPTLGREVNRTVASVLHLERAGGS